MHAHAHTHTHTHTHECPRVPPAPHVARVDCSGRLSSRARPPRRGTEGPPGLGADSHGPGHRFRALGHPRPRISAVRRARTDSAEAASPRRQPCPMSEQPSRTIRPAIAIAIARYFSCSYRLHSHNRGERREARQAPGGQTRRSRREMPSILCCATALASQRTMDFLSKCLGRRIPLRP